MSTSRVPSPVRSAMLLTLPPKLPSSSMLGDLKVRMCVPVCVKA
jgi:hypothetical protein